MVLQAAASPLSEYAVQLGIVAILGVNVWQLKATLAFRDEARMLRQWAFGEHGDNGANGDIKELRKRSHSHGDKLHAHEGRLDIHEMRLDAADRRRA